MWGYVNGVKSRVPADWQVTQASTQFACYTAVSAANFTRWQVPGEPRSQAYSLVVALPVKLACRNGWNMAAIHRSLSTCTVVRKHTHNHTQEAVSHR